MTLYEELKAAGIEIANHASDLYCPATDEALTILKRHPTQRKNARFFRPTCSIPFDGGIDIVIFWLEIPFAYDPYWERRKAPTTFTP